jgi:hypothetical protein
MLLLCQVCGALLLLDEKTPSPRYKEWYVWECNDAAYIVSLGKSNHKVLKHAC